MSNDVSENRSQIPALIGPTGVGKTATGVRLAQELGFEIISADSRQVYEGMDIVTGKEVDQGEWLMVQERRTLVIDGVFIHSLDVVRPDQSYSVFDWVKLVGRLVGEIRDRGRQPLIVGGTGFYLDGLMGRVQTMSLEPDPELRQELQGMSVEELQSRLDTVDGARLVGMNQSDRQNPARLVRAIEIALEAIGSGASGKLQVASRESSFSCNLQLLGLTMGRRELLERVDGRIEHMIAQGAVEETRRLLERYDRNLASMTGIGYGELAAYLAGELSLDQAVAKFKTRVHQYVKRQYTWFNHRPVKWVEVDQEGWENELRRRVEGR